MTDKISAVNRESSVWDLLFFGGLLGCAATVLGFLGRLWWVFDLASHFRVQYFLLLAIVSNLLMLRKRWKQTLLLAGFSLVNLVLILPAYLPVSPGTNNGGSIGFVLLNLSITNQEHEKVRRFLLESDADIILLEEVTPEWERELQVLETKYPFHLCIPLRHFFGIALYSRIQPTEISDFHLVENAAWPSIKAQFEVDGKKWTFFGTHPLPPIGKGNFQLRNQHLMELAKLVAKQKKPVIVMGDLNTTPWSWIFRDLLRIAELRDSRDGFGNQPTWQTADPLMRIPIDHCLISKGLTVTRRWIGPDVGSDHLPVCVEIAND